MKFWIAVIFISLFLAGVFSLPILQYGWMGALIDLVTIVLVVMIVISADWLAEGPGRKE
jgi:hypothetical protein